MFIDERNDSSEGWWLEMLKDKLKHIQFFKSLLEQKKHICLNWAACSLADRKDFQGAVQNERPL